MALVYEFDVAPHQRRLMAIRAQRLERWHQLHDHDGRATFWIVAAIVLALFWSAVGYGIDQLV